MHVMWILLISVEKLEEEEEEIRWIRVREVK